LSPYNYVANNPLVFIDPNGQIITLPTIYDDDSAEKRKYKENIIATYNAWSETEEGAAFKAKYGDDNKDVTINLKLRMTDQFGGNTVNESPFAKNEKDAKINIDIFISSAVLSGQTEYGKESSGFDLYVASSTLNHEAYAHADPQGLLGIPIWGIQYNDHNDKYRWNDLTSTTYEHEKYFGYIPVTGKPIRYIEGTPAYKYNLQVQKLRKR
jgi:hypothetical protein